LERVGEGWGEWGMEEGRWVGEDVIGGRRRMLGKWLERQSGKGKIEVRGDVTK